MENLSGLVPTESLRTQDSEYQYERGKKIILTTRARAVCLGDRRATNHHHRQLQTAVARVLDEQERNQKKGNHLNTISKMMGTHNSSPAVQL